MCKSIAIVAALGFFGMAGLTLLAVDTARSAPVGRGDNPFPFTLRDVQVDSGKDDDGSKSGKNTSKSKTTTPSPQSAPKPPRK